MHAEICDQRACFAIATLFAWSASVRLIDVSEDCCKPSCRRCRTTTRNEEVNVGNVAANRAEQSRLTERGKDRRVAWIIEHCGTRESARWSLHETRAIRRRKQRTARDLKSRKRIRRDRCCQVRRVAAIPVDFTASVAMSSIVIIVVAAESGPEVSDHALDRVR